MIRYTLKCSKDHVFESWFASASGFETLKTAGRLSCAVCGDAAVDKTLMAPAVAVASPAPETPERAVPSEAPKAAEGPALPDLTTPTTPQEVALQKLKDHVEANSEHVGRDFARRARAMHDGTEPDTPIHGEASLKEAKSLVEDGVPIAPLPFMTTRRTN
ncbi:MAG: DUF1178 family protein [Pseudomonadota bacterium]